MSTAASMNKVEFERDLSTFKNEYKITTGALAFAVVGSLLGTTAIVLTCLSSPLSSVVSMVALAIFTSMNIYLSGVLLMGKGMSLHKIIDAEAKLLELQTTGDNPDQLQNSRTKSWSEYFSSKMPTTLRNMPSAIYRYADSVRDYLNRSGDE